MLDSPRSKDRSRKTWPLLPKTLWKADHDNTHDSSLISSKAWGTGFHYQPITRGQQVRLLRFERTSNSRGNKIILTLAHHDIANAPNYNAVSYTWGFLHPLHTIQINGRTFRVRKNMYEFLERHGKRSADAVDYLWIDQICIDQDNSLEKSEQVSIMGDIFRNADTVLVWLGPGDETVPKIFEAIRRSSKVFPDVMTRISHANKYRTDIDAATDFLYGNRYWSRVWVVQEVLLAKDLLVLCAGETLPWSVLHTFWVTFLSTTGSGTAMNSLLSMRDHGTIGRHSRRFPLIQLIQAFCKNECSKPQDKIFSLQGLVSDSEKQHIDYEKPWVEVYVDAARTCMRNSKAPPPSGDLDQPPAWEVSALIRLAKSMNIDGIHTAAGEANHRRWLEEEWTREYDTSVLMRPRQAQSMTVFWKSANLRLTRIWSSVFYPGRESQVSAVELHFFTDQLRVMMEEIHAMPSIDPLFVVSALFSIIRASQLLSKYLENNPEPSTPKITELYDGITEAMNDASRMLEAKSRP